MKGLKGSVCLLVKEFKWVFILSVWGMIWYGMVWLGSKIVLIERV